MKNLEEINVIRLNDISLLNEDVGIGTCDHEVSVGTTNVDMQCDEVPCPTVGMYFDNVAEVKRFYRKHVVKSCFGVRI